MANKDRFIFSELKEIHSTLLSLEILMGEDGETENPIDDQINENRAATKGAEQKLSEGLERLKDHPLRQYTRRPIPFSMKAQYRLRLFFEQLCSLENTNESDEAEWEKIRLKAGELLNEAIRTVRLEHGRSSPDLSDGIQMTPSNEQSKNKNERICGLYSL